MTIKEAKIYIREELLPFYPKNEIYSFTKIIFQDLFNITDNELITKEGSILPNDEFEKLSSVIKRLKQFEPIQYITGHTEFYDLRFFLSKSVLIPRPETEELVDIIIKENQRNENLKVIDIGTGSGCIAISLKKNLNKAQVFATDISNDAIQTAKKNADYNSAEVNFSENDILKADNLMFGDIEFDLIVSNPPYIKQSEISLMKKNVLDYEPHQALFVTDEKAFVFYEAIILFSENHLSKKGKIYFEINENHYLSVYKLLINNGFINIQIRKDIFGKNRFIIAEK
jgi:release factor glutamine methyltransferase